MKSQTTRKPRPRKGDHVVVHSNRAGAGAKCLHCGDELVVQLPVDLGVWIAAGAAFVKRHKNCPPPSTLNPKAAAMARYQCPIRGCTQHVRRSQAFCRRHLALVPEVYRRSIDRLRATRPRSERYEHAVESAAACVERLLDEQLLTAGTLETIER